MMLTNHRIEYIRNKVRAFSPARIQEFNTLLLILAESNISPAEFHAFTQQIKMEIMTKRNPASEHWRRIAPACPDCRGRLDLIRINTPKGRANVKGYKSCFLCSGEACLYEKYSTQPTNRLIKERERLYNKTNPVR